MTFLKDPDDHFPFTKEELETPREVLTTKYEAVEIGSQIEDMGHTDFLDINDNLIVSSNKEGSLKNNVNNMHNQAR